MKPSSEKHTSGFFQTINIYADSDVECLMLDYVERDLYKVQNPTALMKTREQQIESTKTEFMSIVSKLRNALDVLDHFIVTSITGRCLSNQTYKQSTSVDPSLCERKWNLIVVHRACEPI